MNDEVRMSLSGLVKRYGSSLCDDPTRAENLLRDVCGRDRREINVLVGALREHVAAELLAAGPDVGKVMLIARLAKRLEDNLGLMPEAARWGAESWALALGVVSPAELRPLQSAGTAPGAGSLAVKPPSTRRSAPTPSRRREPSPVSPSIKTATPALINEVQQLLAAGKKIEAIKAYRTATGWGLQEATKAVEAIALLPNPTIGSRTSPVVLQLGSGQVVTVAGSGQAGHVDGRGRAAQFKDPTGIAIDAQGMLYVADHGNGRIRTIGPSGDVASIGAASSWWNVWRDGPLAEAIIDSPIALAIDAQGIVYVAQELGLIRRIKRDGNVDTPARPGGLFASDLLAGLAVTPTGVLYASNRGQMRRWIYKIAPGVPAVKIGERVVLGVELGPFDNPAGLALDAAGNLYVADASKHQILKVTPESRILLVAGKRGGYADGPASEARFREPVGITVDAGGRIYVADSGNNRIRCIERDGTVVTIAGSGQKGFADGPALSAQFNKPRDLALAADGTIYVVDEGNHCVRAIRA